MSKDMVTAGFFAFGFGGGAAEAAEGSPSAASSAEGLRRKDLGIDGANSLAAQELRGAQGRDCDAVSVPGCPQERRGARSRRRARGGMAAFAWLLAPALLALTPLRAPLSGAGTPLPALTPLRSLPPLSRAGKLTAQLRDIFGEKPAVQTWPSDPSITYTDYGLVSREQQRRAYASLDGFLRIANSSRVDAADLRPPLPRPGDEDWLSFERRGAVVLGASLAYPLLLEVLSKLIAADGSLLELTSAFLPAVSIIVGSLLSITLSIEYNRLQKIQDLAASESADLALLTRLIRGVFAGERLAPQRQAALEQVGEQISTLVKRSRREELELMLDRDPIGAIVDVLDAAAGDRAVGADPRLARAAGLTTTLFQTRASRLSAEALSLPQVHFQILAILGGLLIAAYALTGAERFAAGGGVVPPESCLLFGLLTGTYTLMYNFALDLNQPFDGVYQVRRSAAATSLLGARLLLDGELRDGVLAIERGKQLGAEPGPADPRPC